MRYCPRCDTEYLSNNQKTCVDDGTPLLSRRAYEAELARQGRLPQESLHFREIGFGYDRFTADNIAEAIAKEGMESFIISGRGPSAGMLTEPYPAGWAVVVEDENVSRATAIAREVEQAINRSAEQAGRAAEREATEGPSPAPD